MSAASSARRDSVSARLNGIEIYFERFGNGPRLLVLNGSGTSIEQTRTMLDRYALTFEVLVHDQRGLGRTEIPPGPYSMAQYAADAIALLDHVGWSTCRVVGGSFGGMVAQELAVTVPDRIERLALVCTSPGGSHPSYPLHELEPDDIVGLLAVMDTRYTPEFLATHPEHRQVLATLGNERPMPAKTDEQRRGDREQLLARIGHDVVDRLPRIACPTLVQSGTFDGVAPPQNGRLIASLVPGAVYREYDGGHFFDHQDERAIPELLSFLAGVESG